MSRPEREFFEALGSNATVDGKSIKLAASEARLAEIARDAPPELKARIEKIARARAKMKGSPAEKPMPDNPRMNPRGGGRTNAQGSQVARLEQALEAHQEEDAEMDAILGELEQRSGKTRPSSDLPLEIAVSGKQLKVTAKAGPSGVGPSVVQLVLYRLPPRKTQVGPNPLSLLLAQMMGLGPGAMGGGGQPNRLTEAQEQMLNRPLQKTQSLPEIKPEGQLSLPLDLPLSASLDIERIKAKVWSGDGWFEIDDLPGLLDAQTEANEDVQEDRAKAPARPGARPAPRMLPPARPSRPFEVIPGLPMGPNRARPGVARKGAPTAERASSPEEEKARLALMRAKDYLQLKKAKEAKDELAKAARLAPESSFGKEAQILLDRMGGIDK